MFIEHYFSDGKRWDNSYVELHNKDKGFEVEGRDVFPDPGSTREDTLIVVDY